MHVSLCVKKLSVLIFVCSLFNFKLKKKGNCLVALSSPAEGRDSRLVALRLICVVFCLSLPGDGFKLSFFLQEHNFTSLVYSLRLKTIHSSARSSVANNNADLQRITDRNSNLARYFLDTCNLYWQLKLFMAALLNMIYK